MTTLWHYTCDHGHQGIHASGDLVVPARFQTDRVAGMPGEYAWFTDLDAPIRDALGLTSTVLRCDRTTHRYRVTDDHDIFPWATVRRVYAWGPDLEQAPGARPMHWWVATVAVPVVYDPVAARGAA